MSTDFSFRKKFMKVFGALTGALSLSLFVVMLSYAEEKTVIVEGGNPDEIVEVAKEPVLSRWKINFDDSDANPSDDAHISVMIPAAIDATEVSFYTRYDEPAIVVIAGGSKASQLSKATVDGNFFHVNNCGGIFDGSEATLTFELDTPCFAKISLSGHLLNIDLTPCSDFDGTVVAIDPSFGGSQNGATAGNIYEKNVTGEIASYVEAGEYNTQIRVVSIRGGDFSMNTEARLSALENIGADAYVGIRLSTNTEDLHAFGMKASYNAQFFSNDFNSIKFADTVLKNTASLAKDLAIGLFEADETEVLLQVIDIPALYLYAGFLSNEQEAALLANDEYLKTIALGIIGGLDEYYICNGQ